MVGAIETTSIRWAWGSELPPGCSRCPIVHTKLLVISMHYQFIMMTSCHLAQAALAWEVPAWRHGDSSHDLQSVENANLRPWQPWRLAIVHTAMLYLVQIYPWLQQRGSHSGTRASSEEMIIPGFLVASDMFGASQSPIRLNLLIHPANKFS